MKGKKQSVEHVRKRMEARRRNQDNWFASGYSPWNKGKTKETDDRIKKYSEKTIKGRKIHSAGYIEIYMPEHPNSNRGYIFEHIVIAEKKLGRYLYAHEETHHKNEIKDDNRKENIDVMTKSEHTRLHMIGNKHKLGKAPWNKGVKGTENARKSALKAWETRRANNEQNEHMESTNWFQQR